MVTLMMFTKDIYRRFWLRGESAGEPSLEKVDCGDSGSDQNDHVMLSQDVLSGEEGLSEEERARRRAERRRAKKKRRRERKKLEKGKKIEDVEQDGKEEERGVESGLEESESEEETREEEAISRRKGRRVPLAVSGNETNCQPLSSSCEEEPEWDVSSAFVANAASHIRPKDRTKSGPRSKENKENETKVREVDGMDVVTKRSTLLTEEGIKLVQKGQYAQAISMFTEAIRCDPKDYRFFGNRSYCYSCLELYPSALADAEKSLQLAPNWPKGHFRKGRALMGMKKYHEAEMAMEQVLRLDKDCEEAVDELFNCKVLQLMDLGFEGTQSVLLLEKFSTVQAVLASHEAAKVVNQSFLQDQSGTPCPSLWVGNVTTELTEKRLWDLFKVYGEIDSIRVLHESFCAFINFKTASTAARALKKLHGMEIGNTRLVVRYPDRRTPRPLASPLRVASTASQQAGATGSRRRGPVNGDECYFWRTTGCLFGDKCRYKHIPEHCGRDGKPWLP